MTWSEAELQLLRDLYPTMRTRELAARLRRPLSGIYKVAWELGLKKAEDHHGRRKPIGSERMDRGILIRKVTDTGRPKKDWKRVDVIEWEAVHGPIPEGYTLMLKDGSLPRTLENLALYTREEHWQRSSVQRLPPEAVVLVQLKGQITQAINRRLRAEKSARSPASAST